VIRLTRSKIIFSKSIGLLTLPSVIIISDKTKEKLMQAEAFILTKWKKGAFVSESMCMCLCACVCVFVCVCVCLREKERKREIVCVSFSLIIF